MNRRRWYSYAVLFVVLAGLLSAAGPAGAQGEGREAVLLTADGPVTPAMTGYFRRGIAAAAEREAALIIIRLNTPGGSIDSMNDILQDIRGSQMPVVVYVAPSGAMAGSAGTLITLAGEAAAMAPATTIGAASPISGTGQDLEETIALKEKNILKATARALAAQRSLEAIHLAEEMIDSAEAVSAEEALEAGLVDFVAVDVEDLLQQMDGFQLNSGAVLETHDMAVVSLDPSFFEQVMTALTNPNIVILLLNLGVAAILIEIASPGGWVPGFIGVISVALAAYGLGVLPVNWFGMIFLIVAFVLFVLDVFSPTHGALTAAGVISSAIGGLVLFNRAELPGIPQISVPFVIASSLITGGMFFSVLFFALRFQKTPIRTGQESLVGKVGRAATALSPRGQVQLAGELWSAELVAGEQPAPRGARVEVVGVEGLRLLVRKVPSSPG